MLIEATTAVEMIESGEAKVTGWTRGNDEANYAVLSNYKHARTDHVMCGNRNDETESQQRIESLADESSEVEA